MCTSTSTVKILFLGNKQPILRNVSQRVTQSFNEFKLFINYICSNLSSTDKYLLIVPSKHLESLLHDPVYKFPQVESIFVYDDDRKSLQRNDNRYQKLIFFREFELFQVLDHIFINNAIDPSRSIDRPAVDDFISTITQRILSKRPTAQIINDAIREIELHSDDGIIDSVKNGSLVWKIDSVQEKIDDARTKQRLSIYSSPFYSSPNGYKMCLRLYLNGDRDVRGNFMSLFFILMRGENDQDLKWPFFYKVTFHLIDQSSRQNDINASFWPDESSDCFEKPSRNMNEGYGIKRFYSIANLEQNRDVYMRNDAMTVSANVIFNETRPESLGSGGTGEKPNEDLPQTESLDLLLGI